MFKLNTKVKRICPLSFLLPFRGREDGAHMVTHHLGHRTPFITWYGTTWLWCKPIFCQGYEDLAVFLALLEMINRTMMFSLRVQTSGLLLLRKSMLLPWGLTGTSKMKKDQYALDVYGTCNRSSNILNVCIIVQWNLHCSERVYKPAFKGKILISYNGMLRYILQKPSFDHTTTFLDRKHDNKFLINTLQSCW